jgi:hypothetical protein
LRRRGSGVTQDLVSAIRTEFWAAATLDRRQTRQRSDRFALAVDPIAAGEVEDVARARASDREEVNS